MQVIVDDLMTEYLRLGREDAPVVLMLPGWKASVADFAKLMKDQTNDFDVVALDFPGFGTTQTPGRAWTVQDYTDFVAKFIEKLGLKKIHAIIGHSFGGRIMLDGCARGQLNAKKLVFIDSAGVKPKVSMRNRIIRTAAKLARVFPEEFRTKIGRRFGSEDYKATSGVMRDTFRQIVNLDLTPEMCQIKQPTLLIWGADDTYTPLSDAEIFADKIPQAKLEIVEGAGHYAFLDQPEKVAKLIREFLR
ncbi:alpha/beta hydrolase [Candidatus Saccharibacteria bacterium]|nr:alpha/beta hydrolase [Candidatus Saccharibacteria bacterium]